MADSILDHFEESKMPKITPEESKGYRQFLALLWILFAFWLLFISFEIFSILFQIGEDPMGWSLIDVYIVQVEYAYKNMLQCFVNLLIAYLLIKNKPKRKETILIYLGSIYFFYGIAFIKSGFPDDLISLENIFFCLLIYLSFAYHKERLFPLSLKDIREEFLPLLLIGFLPFFMHNLIDYKIIHFWDISWLF